RESVERRAIGDVERERRRTAALTLDVRHDLRGGIALPAVGQDHVRALVGEVQCHVPAEPAAGTGDDGNRHLLVLLGWLPPADAGGDEGVQCGGTRPRRGCPELRRHCLILQKSGYARWNSRAPGV